MKAQRIIDTYKTRFKKIAKYYYILLEDFGEKDIHYFRVEMKKLRAFLRLINLADPVRQHKLSKGLKSFYTIAGNLRNLQLHRQRIASLSSGFLMKNPVSYLQNLREEEQQMKERARQIAGSSSLKDFEDKLTEDVPGQLTRMTANAFVQSRAKRLEELFTLPFYYDEALHEIRKLVKDLMYDYQYIKTAVATDLPPALNQLKRMEALTSALGDFHDLCIALFLLGPMYVDRIAESDETTVLNELRTQLQIRKEEMKNKIIEKLIPVKQQIVKMKAISHVYEIL